MTTLPASGPRIDRTLNKFSQACVVLLSAVAFLTNQAIIVPILAVCLAISAVAPTVSPFRLLYRAVFVLLGILKPRPVEDDPAPHHFAQGVGAVFTLASTLVLFLTPLKALGWGLDLIVFVLAGINFSVGFCAGCFVYYHLGRIGVVPRVRYAGDFHWRGV
ncbi:MAG: DUF4395 domain-containing protein [Ktedonobacterales bacterium]|nr:DUF4395 domain-containing protein [Ktedonobacterales bacterium]